jgi:hypothetical protein
MTPESVAGIVDRCSEGTFINLLREADAEFLDPQFEPQLAEALRTEPRLIDSWATYSAEQRWTPSAYVDGSETSWYDAGYRHVRVHSDAAAAVADFIHRLTAWLARREVIDVDG